MSKGVIRLLAVLVLLGLSGCFFNDLGFQVRFNKNPGLAAGDPVIFDGNTVGTVKKITYTENGDYLMDVSVQSEFKNAATVDSVFYIAAAPDNPEKRVLMIEQEKPGGTVLKERALVTGADQRGFLDRFLSDLTTGLQTSLERLKKEIEKNSGQMESGIENTINSISNQLGKFNQEVKQLPEREEVKQLGKSLNQLRSDMMETEASIRNKIQTEIIPEIEKELESLKKRMAPSGREKEVAPLENEVQKIKNV